MSINNDPNQRNKSSLRDVESPRTRITTNDSHILNLPPPPLPLPPSSTNHQLSTIRASPIPGNFNIPPPPSSILSDTMSTFNKELLRDVLQQGLGVYVYIDHFGLVPKLNHF
jgi:hypothetical protein